MSLTYLLQVKLKLRPTQRHENRLYFTLTPKTKIVTNLKKFTRSRLAHSFKIIMHYSVRYLDFACFSGTRSLETTLVRSLSFAWRRAEST